MSTRAAADITVAQYATPVQSADVRTRARGRQPPSLTAVTSGWVLPATAAAVPVCPVWVPPERGSERVRSGGRWVRWLM